MGGKRLQKHQPTSRFSNLCFSDCKVCDSCVKVSAGPLDTSPIVFLVPVSFLLPPGRASPGSAPLWLSHRVNFEVSSLIVSFWLMIVSFCCKTVSRNCITVLFKSSPGTLFCKVAAHMSISLGTDVQMNCVCPAKSWDKLSKNTPKNRKSLQQNPFLFACMLASVVGFVLVDEQRTDFALLLLYSVSGSAPAFIPCARLCAEWVYCITTRGAGIELCPSLERLQKSRHSQEMKPILLSGSRMLNLSSLRLFVISRRVLFISEKKTRISCQRRGLACVEAGQESQLCLYFVSSGLETQTHCRWMQMRSCSNLCPTESLRTQHQGQLQTHHIITETLLCWCWCLRLVLRLSRVFLFWGSLLLNCMLSMNCKFNVRKMCSGQTHSLSHRSDKHTQTHTSFR